MECCTHDHALKRSSYGNSSAQEMQPHAIQSQFGVRCRTSAIARPIERGDGSSAIPRQTDVYGSHRLVRAEIAGTGYADGANREVSSKASPTANRHRLGNLRANRPMFVEQQLWHAQDVDLDPVVVRNHAAKIPGMRLRRSAFPPAFLR